MCFSACSFNADEWVVNMFNADLTRPLTFITQARVIHSSSSEWVQIQAAVQAIKATAEADDNEIGLQTCEELLEALHLSRCMLIMGYVFFSSLWCTM
jgi:hypothetical protein